MIQNLDQELIDQIRGLTLEYSVEPQPELLIPIPNSNPEVGFEVTIQSAEFTSLCPLHTAQPDFARISITYEPMNSLVELKSLKLYLVSYRMAPVFHEEVPATILKHLVDLLSPRHMRVIGEFTTRGGIDTSVQAYWVHPSLRQQAEDE